MKVSVVLPTFHHPETVSRAIKSVLDQTFKDFELIIIDDGSNDGTSDILDHFRQIDPRVRVFRNETNSGSPAQVCNKAVRDYAGGEYIAFQFDDDFWFEWCLENLLNGSAEYDFVYGQTLFIDTRDKQVIFIKGNLKINQSNILTANQLANNAVLIKRSVFLELGGFDDSPIIKRVCDWELWIRVFHKGYRVNMIPQMISVCMPYHPHSIGVTYELDHQKVLRYIKDKLGIKDENLF